MNQTPFGPILERLVSQTPGAVGAALAAQDGETVDSWVNWNHDDWPILTAHFGILSNHIRNALHTFHFGDVRHLQFSYANLHLIIYMVEADYYTLLALVPPLHLGIAMKQLDSASIELQREMG